MSIRKDPDIFAAGIQFVKFPHDFSQDLGTEITWAANIWFGWNFGAHIHEQIVYEYMKTLLSGDVLNSLRPNHVLWRAMIERARGQYSLV